MKNSIRILIESMLNLVYLTVKWAYFTVFWLSTFYTKGFSLSMYYINTNVFDSRFKMVDKKKKKPTKI